MYKVYPKTTYSVMDESTYKTAADGLENEPMAMKMAQALNEQAEHSKKKLEAVERELSELKALLPS